MLIEKGNSVCKELLRKKPENAFNYLRHKRLQLICNNLSLDKDINTTTFQSVKLQDNGLGNRALDTQFLLYFSPANISETRL